MSKVECVPLLKQRGGGNKLLHIISKRLKNTKLIPQRDSQIILISGPYASTYIQQQSSPFKKKVKYHYSAKILYH